MKGCDIMSIQYDNTFKLKLCKEVCVLKKSTIKTSEAYGVPLKTLEKWITSFNKDPHCFDLDKKSGSFQRITPLGNSTPYDQLSSDELISLIMKKDIEIARLKKNYIVKGGGTENKVFVTFSNKNTL